MKADFGLAYLAEDNLPCLGANPHYSRDIAYRHAGSKQQARMGMSQRVEAPADAAPIAAEIVRRQQPAFDRREHEHRLTALP